MSLKQHEWHALPCEPDGSLLSVPALRWHACIALACMPCAQLPAALLGAR